ncbi:MAG: hypothetical protein U0Y08_03745 [Bacteroidia bacterium]
MTDLEKILAEVDYTLQNVSNKPFTQAAFDKFKERIGVYISSLFNESQKTATRNQTDNISASHVESASQYLIKNQSSKFSKLSGILGGIFLGATVSNVLSMTVLGQQFSMIGFVVTILLGAIGSFLIGINIIKD